MQVDDLKAKLVTQEVELRQKNEDTDKLIQVVGMETRKVSREKAIADEEEQKVARRRERDFSWKNCTVWCMGLGMTRILTESVDILEDLVIEFIPEMTHKAMSIGRQGRVQVEDIVFLIRKDPRKFARVKDLLTMNEELKRARKAFDEANYESWHRS